MVIRMRHNRSQRGNTRSHDALKDLRTAKCPDCGTQRMNHRACPNCGKYNGRVVIDVLKKVAKKEKKLKEEEKATK